MKAYGFVVDGDEPTDEPVDLPEHRDA